MNASKSTLVHICKRYLPYVLVYLTGVCILLYAYRSIIVYPLTSDALGYAKQIETGAITSWWSALFMYECRFILHILRFVFGEGVRVELSIYIVYFMCITIMIFAVHMALKMIENRYSRTFIPACIMCGCLCFAYLLGVGSFHNITRLDAPGSALLFSAVVFTLNVRRGESVKKVCMWLFLIVILMVHACSYRTPFLMVALFVSLYLGYVWEPKRTWFRILMRGGLICMTFYTCFVLTNHALPPYEHRDDTMKPMFQSDMKISGILEGDGEILDRLAEVYSLRLSTSDAVVKRYHLISSDYGVLRRGDVWPVLKEAYFQRWRKSTGLMVEARLIQMFHYLTGGFTPVWFKKLVEHRHPHVNAYGLVLGRYEWPRCSRTTTFCYMLALLVCLCGIVFPLVLLLSKRVRMGDSVPILLYLSAVCASSMACYLIVVVPTPDFRYRMQTLLLSSLAISMAWSVVSNRLKHVPDAKSGTQDV